MAYYTALIAKWPTLSPGTTAAKLAQLNSQTVAAAGQSKVIVTPSQILNACVPADLASLTAVQVSLLSLLLSGNTVDASVGTTVRAGILAIFNGKTTTLSQLAALVAPLDAPTIPWWQATVAQGGGALNGPVGLTDLALAGNLT